MRKLLVVIIILAALAPAAQAWEARVVGVADCDTITVEPVQGGARTKVRLHGIDCPELNQPYGRTANGFVQDVALWQTVEVQVTPQGQDQYGRTVAVVVMSNGKSLQELLLEAGLAWVYPQYCKNCGEWEALQKQAQNESKGLWADKSPVAPWKWRKR